MAGSFPLANSASTGTSSAGGMPAPSAASIAIPLPYLVTGIGAAGLFGLLLPWIAPDALLAPDLPHVLALVHIATLGWLTMLILGASLQLVPVMTVGPLRAARFVRWQFPIYVAGVVTLVSGFWLFAMPLIILGGVLVVLAVLHHVVMLEITLLRAHTRTLSTRFLVAAFGYLLIVVGLGLTMALDLQFSFLDTFWQRVLLTHLVLGIAGWLTSTLAGVSYTLIRMFALVHGHDERLGRTLFALMQGGILALALGSVLGWGWLQFAGGVALCSGIWLFAADVMRMFRRRRRRPLDVTLRHSIAAVAYLAMGAPLIVAALIGSDPRAGHRAALLLMVLVGWLGQSTVGYLYKIVPFLVWQGRFSPLLGRSHVPLMRDLVRQHWAEASWWLVNLGLPATIITLAGGWVWPVRIAAGVLALGLALATINIWGAASRRPQSG